MKNTLSIYAQALVEAQEYKNLKINGSLIGVKEAMAWKSAIKTLRIPAYTIRSFRYDNMGKAEVVEACDQSPLYNALRPVIELIGEVNGAKLNPQNIAEEVIASVLRLRVIDITNEMASARSEYREASKAYKEDDCDDNKKTLDDCKAEVTRLEAEAGNCKKIKECLTESAFITAVEKIFSDAITAQCLKTPEQVLAEEEAKKEARKAAAKLRKAKKANK